MEIKLRAWDKINKRMIYIESFSQIPSNWKDVWILMLFTGLHDKHGEEIWEGDIVKWHDPEYGSIGDEIAPIEFKEASFCHGHITLRDIDMKFLEVIGNIYEGEK